MQFIKLDLLLAKRVDKIKKMIDISFVVRTLLLSLVGAFVSIGITFVYLILQGK